MLYRPCITICSAPLPNSNSRSLRLQQAELLNDTEHLSINNYELGSLT